MTKKADAMIADKVSALWSAVRKLRDATQVAASESPKNKYTQRAAETLEQAAYLLAEASMLEDNWVAEDAEGDDL